MEWLFVVFLVLAVPLGLVIWLINRAVSARAEIERLGGRLSHVELELSQLKRGLVPTPEPASQAMPTEPAISRAAATPSAPPPTPVAEPPPQPELEPTFAPSAALPPVSVPVPVMMSSPAGIGAAAAEGPESAPPVLPPSEPALAAVPRPASPRPEFAPAINWEQFMGVKMFAWVGGLALFLGVAFFVKYSFENNLISPEMRVALGFLAGIGLLGGGVVLSRRDYQVLAQTLCATGIVILYAVTFACHSVYHFAFFGPIATFLLMVLITATAFLLAVTLEAQVVAILGMLGGFLTPVLLSTGQDNPFGLFGYIALLDLGLLVVALHRRWFYLAALAALGTALMQIGWASEFFSREKYFLGNKVLIAMGVLLGFELLYLVVVEAARRLRRENWWLLGSFFALGALALAFSGWFLSFNSLANRPWLMFSFVFLLDLALMIPAARDVRLASAMTAVGLAVFALLGFWTVDSLKTPLLNAGLVFYFTYAVFHSLAPLAAQRWTGVQGPVRQSAIFPPLALALMLIPIFRLTELSFLVWPFVLLLDVLAIALAVVTASAIAVVVALLLTLGATAALVLKIPETLVGFPSFLWVLAGFSIFFVLAGTWLTRKFNPNAFKGGLRLTEDALVGPEVMAHLPSLSAMLPFLLLMMATLRLPLTNPTPIFGLALLLCILLLGIARMFSINGLAAAALLSVAALECTWQFNRFKPDQAATPLTWYLIFLSVFAVFPFVFRKAHAGKVVPWATAALAGPVQFFLVHRLVKEAYPNGMMGLLPAGFAILPLASLVVILKGTGLARDDEAASASQRAQLAWFGGVALFFITLIFPIQFERQWITIGWALEGAALIWLFQRVPHRGLVWTGTGLLVAAFVRLAFNPAVLEYHPRSATPILNWYLYAYGLVTVCLYAGARLMGPPENRVRGLNLSAMLASLGTVLAFLLLNIQIADFFSAPGSTLTFQFRGNFARDMTYSIAWALFALTLLVFGIVRKSGAARYAALALLSVTLLKLFFHDMARLGQLYRIGALVGVAIIAMLASLAYQRFFRASPKPAEAHPEVHEKVH